MKTLFMTVFMALFTQLSQAQTTYELVTSSQTDWSGNYVLVGPWNPTTGYAFEGTIDDNTGDITPVTLDGNTISSIGSAAMLTIAQSNYNSSRYSIRINGGAYLADGTSGLTTETTETQYTAWSITYTNNGMQIYNPIWNGGPYYLYFLVYEIIASGNYGAFFVTDNGSGFTNTSDYNFTYILPILYKETSSGGGNDDCDISEDFESVTPLGSLSTSTGNLPSGWTGRVTGSGTTYYPTITSNTALGTEYLGFSSRYLYLTSPENSGSNNYGSYVILPRINDISSLKFSYQFEHTSSGGTFGTFVVGYATSQTITSTNDITVLQTVTSSSSIATFTLSNSSINTLNSNNGYLVLWYYGNTNTTYYYGIGIDDICIQIEGGGGIVEDCEDFESYSSSANTAISGGNTYGLPAGWSSAGNTGNYKPHLYKGNYSVDGVGIVMTSGTNNYGGNNSYLISNITLHEGDEVSFNTFRESASSGTMYYGYWSNSAFQSIGTATGVVYSNANASQGVTTFIVPAAAEGKPLAWRWYYGSSYWSAVIDNVCVTHYYTVTYNSNGGTGTMTDSNNPYGENSTVTVLPNSFTGPNYQTFNGWNTAADGSGTSYLPGATFNITANITLYAQWLETWTSAVHSKPSTYTEGTTVNITCANDLAWAISVVNGLNGHTAAPSTNFNVTTDINMDAHVWVPMGTASNPYTGTFNANGHHIEGLHSLLNTENMGMFGSINGTVENMILYASFTEGNPMNIGSVAATMVGGTISNVETGGTLTGTANAMAMGGLVGSKTGGTIHSSFSVNTITANNTTTQVGGLVGNNAGNLYNSYANATISGTGQIGGLVGKNNGTVENCYAVVGTQTFPAFAYENAESGTIQYCYADNANGYVTNTISGSSLQGHGTYSLPIGRKALGYMYGDNAVTLVSGTSTYVHGNTIDYNDNHLINWNGLLWSLNKWVKGHSGYTPWFRPTSNLINGDLPVLGFPSNNCLGTIDADGKYLAYGSTYNSANGLDNLLYIFNNNVGDAASSLFLYGNAIAVTNVPESQVKVFVNEDAVLIQADGSRDFINTTVGVTFDNSHKAATTWNQLIGTQTLSYDWHFLSSPLQNAPLGIVYTDEAEHHWWGPYGDNAQVESVSGSYLPDGIESATKPGGGSVGWDIYTFYEPQYHWINLKRNSASHFHFDEPHDNIVYTNETTFIPGKGYMMAVETDSYLSNTGTLTNKDFTVDLTADSPSPGDDEKGCNLIGNPYQAYLDLDQFFSKNGLSCAWVYIAESNNYVPYPAGASTNPVLPSRYLHPHQAFFVKVTGDKTVNLNKTMATAGQNDSYYRGQEHVNYPLVNLFAYNEKGQRDFVVVEFDRPDKGGASKMTARNNAPFSLTAQDGQEDYTILFTDKYTKRVPIRFVTTEDDTFTLKWETYHGTFGKLLLIDNITGTSCDMTVNDHYTFQGHVTDYANRFYLVVSTTDVDEFNEDNGHEFAYFNGSEWIVNGQGQLDLIDMTGRVIYSKYLPGEHNSVNFGNVAAGVYVLRFGNKVQKIVMR